MKHAFPCLRHTQCLILKASKYKSECSVQCKPGSFAKQQSLKSVMSQFLSQEKSLFLFLCIFGLATVQQVFGSCWAIQALYVYAHAYIHTPLYTRLRTHAHTHTHIHTHMGAHVCTYTHTTHTLPYSRVIMPLLPPLRANSEPVIVDVRVAEERTSGATYKGVHIVTLPLEHSVHVMIESGRWCCEEYGFEVVATYQSDGSKVLIDAFWGKITDDLCALEALKAQLAGSDVVQVGWADGECEEELRTREWFDRWESKTLSVGLSTSAGIRLVVTLFNTHNGYYSHDTFVKWHDFQDGSNDL